MLSSMLCLRIDKTSGGFGRVIHRQHKLELFLFSTSMVSEVNSKGGGGGGEEFIVQSYILFYEVYTHVW